MRPHIWQGRGASPGIIVNKALVLKGDYYSIGDIDIPSFPFVLIARMTKPDLVSLIIRASAVVTDIGGVMSHAAIIALEFGIPCVVATGSASEYIKTGDLIEVDGDTGVVRLIDQVN